MDGRRRTLLRYTAAAGASLLLGACEREAARPAAKPAPPRVTHFAAGAIRLDLRHSVRAGADTLQIERLRGAPHWGSRTFGLTEPPDWGDFRCSLFDAHEGTLLMRCGFDTPLAPGAQAATAAVSVRVPTPKRPVYAVIEKRRAGVHWAQVLATTLDPAWDDIDRSPPTVSAHVEPLLSTGDAASRLDLAILGDGYAESERAKFVSDARRAMGYLLAVKPFGARRNHLNVRAIFTPSAESGVSDRFLGVEKGSALGCTYGSGDHERTLSADNLALHEAAASAPYDFVLVLANSRRYGGSAYFGGPAVVAVDSALADYLVVHELGHAIGGLAEEYYIPDGGGPVYRGNLEPWNPNVTLSPAGAKWRESSGSAPARREWNRAEYEKRFADYVKRYESLRARRVPEAEVEKLMLAERERLSGLLARGADTRRVGLFEGANGYARGVYRSQVDCIMFSLQNQRFCIACEAALDRMIGYCASPS